MSFFDVLSTIFEFLLVSFVIWAVFHEDKFIRFEERIASGFKRRKLKVIKPQNNSAFLLNNE